MSRDLPTEQEAAAWVRGFEAWSRSERARKHFDRLTRTMAWSAGLTVAAFVIFAIILFNWPAKAETLLPCNPNPSDFCYCGYCKGIDPVSHGGVVTDEMNAALEQVSKNFDLEGAIERSACPKTFIYAFTDPDNGEAIVVCH